MTTYAQVLLKRELITRFAKLFGYTEEVKIYYDVPDEDEEKTKLRFVVKEDPEKSVSSEPYYNRSSWLGAKLSAELGCEADIVVDEYIPNLGCHDVMRKSALITDEQAIKKVIYKINNELNSGTPVDDAKINVVKLEDIECKNIEGEEEKSLQKILLRKADEYLKKNVPQQTQNASSKLYDAQGLLGEKRRKTAASPEEGSQQKKTRPTAEPSDGQMPASVSGNGSTSPRKTS